MQPFEFKNTHTFSEAEYHDIHRTFAKKTRVHRKVLIVLVAVACYFSAYTILIGIGITLLVIIDIFTDKISRFAIGNTYKESKVLKKRVTYGISESSLSMEGNDVYIIVGWSMIKVWQLHDKWLRIACDQIPSFYFDIDKLKEKGLLDKVLNLCNKHGLMFDSKENKERYEDLLHTMGASSSLQDCKG